MWHHLTDTGSNTIKEVRLTSFSSVWFASWTWMHSSLALTTSFSACTSRLLTSSNSALSRHFSWASHPCQSSRQSSHSKQTDTLMWMWMCGQSGHTPLVYTAACHAPWQDPDWTMPDALNRGRAVCSSSQVASDRESRVFYRGVDSVAIGWTSQLWQCRCLSIVIVNP